jgi:hypothetical protein
VGVAQVQFQLFMAGLLFGCKDGQGGKEVGLCGRVRDPITEVLLT